jgi:signal peptidase II
MNLKNFRLKNGYYLLTIALPVLILDQITKVWAVNRLKGGDRIVVFESWWSFVYAENRGALWGLGGNFPEFYRKLIFLGFSTLVTLVIVYLLFTYAENVMLRLVFAFVIGGAAGNLYDRFYRGYVVDFIDWHAAGHYHWPTFNIADAAIVVSIALLAIETLFLQQKQDKKEDKK